MSIVNTLSPVSYTHLLKQQLLATALNWCRTSKTIERTQKICLRRIRNRQKISKKKRLSLIHIQMCIRDSHNHSYGFRATRSSHHAVSRVTTLINLSKYHYCVDVDSKGFFDNVNHGKLLKQIWTLGSRDKRLICIISKRLKAEIDGEGVPEKGTPQGGLLSPLLSLIVLNELDWWASLPTAGRCRGSTFRRRLRPWPLRS